MQAQAAAKRALALLDAPHSPEGAFAALFLTRQSRCASCDAFWRASLPLTAAALGESADQPEYRCQSLGSCCCTSAHAHVKGILLGLLLMLALNLYALTVQPC